MLALRHPIKGMCHLRTFNGGFGLCIPLLLLILTKVVPIHVFWGGGLSRELLSTLVTTEGFMQDPIYSNKPGRDLWHLRGWCTWVPTLVAIKQVPSHNVAPLQLAWSWGQRRGESAVQRDTVHECIL